MKHGYYFHIIKWYDSIFLRYFIDLFFQNNIIRIYSLKWLDALKKIGKRVEPIVAKADDIHRESCDYAE